MRLAGKPIYPNLFVLLMGRPGVGKSVSIDEARNLWTATGKFNVAPDRVTGRGLINTMKRGLRTFGQGDIYTTSLVGSSEFGVLVSSHDLNFMSILNTFYDCLPKFEDETGQYGNIAIDHPHLALISGAQPKFFSEVMPEVAYELGFTSRLIMVYSSEVTKVKLFQADSVAAALHAERSDLFKTLAYDLTLLADIHGEFRFEPDAATELELWYESGMEPVPEHPNLQNYTSRRIMHITKLCMAYSISRDSGKLISAEDLMMAREVLLEAESLMPEIFREMSKSTHGAEMEELFQWMWQRYMKPNRAGKPNKEPIPQHHMMAFMRSRVPARDIPYMIGHMVHSGMIQKLTEGEESQLVFYKPLGREDI